MPDDIENNQSVIEEELFKKLIVDEDTFYFVVDWLSDTEILYVENEEDLYVLKTFHVNTGEVNVLHKESAIIVDALIHPSKEKLLIHTTDQPMAGTVKILSLEGVVEHTVTIESAELEIEWNDLEPSLILFTAFYEDWSYDVFLYDGLLDDFHLMTFEDPFPKWLGTEKIVVNRSAAYGLEAGELSLYNRVTKQRQRTNLQGVFYYDTYEDALLVMQVDEEAQATYTVLDEQLNPSFDWKTSLNQELEAINLEVDWFTSQKLRLVDVQQDESQLVEVADGQQSILVEDFEEGPVRCSPSGDFCLIGYAFDKFVALETQEEVAWLAFEESEQ